MRELRTRQQISDWINERLQVFPECAGARATVQYELQQSDSEGCNWSRDLILNYGTCDSVLVSQRLRPIYEEARRRFNVREP